MNLAYFWNKKFAVCILLLLLLHFCTLVYKMWQHIYEVRHVRIKTAEDSETSEEEDKNIWKKKFSLL